MATIWSGPTDALNIFSGRFICFGLLLLLSQTKSLPALKVLERILIIFRIIIKHERKSMFVHAILKQLTGRKQTKHWIIDICKKDLSWFRILIVISKHAQRIWIEKHRQNQSCKKYSSQELFIRTLPFPLRKPSCLHILWLPTHTLECLFSLAP